MDVFASWRLAGIVDVTQGSCGGGSGPCIDETVFGPTVAKATVDNFYFSATTNAGYLLGVWGVYFDRGLVGLGGESAGFEGHGRGVRSAL